MTHAKAPDAFQADAVAGEMLHPAPVDPRRILLGPVIRFVNQNTMRPSRQIAAVQTKTEKISAVCAGQIDQAAGVSVCQFENRAHAPAVTGCGQAMHADARRHLQFRAAVNTFRQKHRTVGLACLIQCLLNRSGVVADAVPPGAERQHIEHGAVRLAAAERISAGSARRHGSDCGRCAQRNETAP
ncbi:MAG: hypothetical protein BWY83_00354 [bacterium ADurb.Bin478]|nr:MAG: hypothetical protein BWY83_00354 [bacterium ADurb.Bin478]